jgi:2-oxoglutarate dehydrogenase E2 component (dihydrolipoamide succinyltransferase)
VLTSRKVEAGATVEVGAVLATLGVGAAASKAAEKPASKPPPAAAKPSGPKLEPAPVEEGEPGGTPAKAVTLDPQRAPRTAPGGRIGAADLVSFLSGQELSPAVRRLVGEHGLDPSRIPASGKDGRLTKEDVETVVRDPSRLKPAPMARQDKGAGVSLPGGAPATAPLPAPAAGGERRERMTKLRQTIARRLKEAQNTAAMLTTFNEVDMSAVMALRSRHKEAFEKAHGVKLGFLSFFAKAVVAAAKAVPAVNARIDGEEIVYWQRYDLGMAVSTQAGLMVPVIRDCEGKSMAEIEKALIDLAARARDGKLKLDELQGGTFTITNGGVFGSLLSTPILNPPQSGILGLHKIEERPIARDGQVVIRPMMYLALSYDHRLVDGREAVTFLVKVKEAIEEPERLLLGL